MGILGIFQEKYKRLGSFSPVILRWEARSEAGGSFRYTFLEEDEAIEMQSLVSEHKVTAASRVFGRWLLHIKKAEEKGVQSGMTQIFQYFHALKSTNHFVRSIEKFIEHANTIGGEFKRNVDRFLKEIVSRLITHIEEIEKWGGIDTQTLMAIMNEAKSKGEAKAVIAFKRAFKTSISKLGKFAMRKDIRIELGDIKRLEEISQNLERINLRLEKEGKGSYEEIFKEFQTLVTESDKDILDMYRAGHLIMKRDLLLVMIILSDDKIMERFGEGWVQKHFMPEKPINEGIMKIEEINKELFNKAHTMANGLGVILKNLKGIEEKLEYVLTKSK